MVDACLLWQEFIWFATLFKVDALLEMRIVADTDRFVGRIHEQEYEKNQQVQVYLNRYYDPFTTGLFANLHLSVKRRKEESAANLTRENHASPTPRFASTSTQELRNANQQHFVSYHNKSFPILNSDNSYTKLSQVQKINLALPPLLPLLALQHRIPTTTHFLWTIDVCKVPSTGDTFAQYDLALLLLARFPCGWRRGFARGLR